MTAAKLNVNVTINRLSYCERLTQQEDAPMLMREAMVTRAGRIFIGRFRVTGEGSAASVMVQFETAVICARKGKLPEEEVAQTLLGELVQEALSDGQRSRH